IFSRVTASGGRELVVASIRRGHTSRVGEGTYPALLERSGQIAFYKAPRRDGEPCSLVVAPRSLPSAARLLSLGPRDSTTVGAWFYSVGAPVSIDEERLAFVGPDGEIWVCNETGQGLHHTGVRGIPIAWLPAKGVLLCRRSWNTNRDFGIEL